MAARAFGIIWISFRGGETGAISQEWQGPRRTANSDEANKSLVLAAACRMYNFKSAPVAQLDRAIASGAIGREFESLRARQQSRGSGRARSIAALRISPAGSRCAHARKDGLKFESLRARRQSRGSRRAGSRCPTRHGEPVYDPVFSSDNGRESLLVFAGETGTRTCCVVTT